MINNGGGGSAKGGEGAFSKEDIIWVFRRVLCFDKHLLVVIVKGGCGKG